MYIAVDVGGTNIRVAGSDKLDSFNGFADIQRTPVSHVYEQDVRSIAHMARSCAGRMAIGALGICVPGRLNDHKTGLASAKNLASWADKPLVEDLSRQLDCPVILDTDARATVLGEATYGHLDKEFDYVIWGTGIGGARTEIVDGEVVITPTLWSEYFADWEAVCGGGSLEKLYGKKPTEFTRKEWCAVQETFSERFGAFLEKRNPKSVIFSGGLALANEGVILATAQSHGIHAELTQFGEDSGLVGALALLKDK